MTKPLEGIRVLDLTQFLSGPQATLFLAGLGAEVIRIDNPATGDPVAYSPPYIGEKGVSYHPQTDEGPGNGLSQAHAREEGDYPEHQGPPGPRDVLRTRRPLRHPGREFLRRRYEKAQDRLRDASCEKTLFGLLLHHGLWPDGAGCRASRATTPSPRPLLAS